MLDELDALMERMLALPVNDADDPPAKPAVLPLPSSSPLSPVLPLTAKLTLLQVPVEEPALDPAHPGTNPSHLPVLNATIPLPPLAPAAPTVMPQSFTAQPFTDHVIPRLAPATTEMLVPEPLEPADPFTRWFILPLVWGNRLFDRGTFLLGEPGGWLRGPAGRAVLGIVGLALVAAASVWLMRDWLGWTW
jgi:hypothetical protein